MCIISTWERPDDSILELALCVPVIKVWPLEAVMEAGCWCLSYVMFQTIKQLVEDEDCAAYYVQSTPSEYSNNTVFNIILFHYPPAIEYRVI